MSYNYSERLSKVVRQHQEWRTRECLNLIPSENRGSPQMRSMFLADLGGRYNAPDRFYRGTKYADELQSITEEIARKVFGARYADVRSLSGHTADMAVLLSLTTPGDKILSVHPDNGGYPGITHLGLGSLLKLQNLYFPYDDRTVNIEPKESAQLMRSASPKVVFFGSSFIPFPHPTKQLSNVADGTCVYDGSHVLGLIAGGEFQDPLREGCSLLIGSTHKSFPGPQGGIILSNDEEAFNRVVGKIHPGIVDNIHLDRVAALAVALIEMLQFGKSYAQAVVKNSQALARALAEHGVKVRGAAAGYTKSHQVLLDYDQSRLEFLSMRLEQANIIGDNGGRLGTSELTRMGYGVKEMEQVAELVSLIILGKKPPDFVQKKVKTLVKQFQQPRFVLTSFPKLE
ncbi:MAG: serine hydroxymethyltransferase [Nitrososphaerota archaeon]|nr:serine hydroxymethyltransferase [Nitrososphaerota archaeon]MDG7023212.1 serine hydroxymethyltransferase [Nitrososphaerota archaeon]